MDTGIPCRELHWEEKTTEQRVEKLAEAVEVLGRSVLALEAENAMLRQHLHAAEPPDWFVYEPGDHTAFATPAWVREADYGAEE